jgi:hypothetical protein
MSARVHPRARAVAISIWRFSRSTCSSIQSASSPLMPRDAVAPAVALHHPGIAEYPHGDARVLLADRPIHRSQVLADVVEVGHLVPGRFVATRRGDTTPQGIRPVLVATGPQVVAADRDRHDRPGTVAGDVSSPHLGGDLADDGAGAGDEDRVGTELRRQPRTGSLVEFALAGAGTEPGGGIERMRCGAVIVVGGSVAVDAAARAVGIAQRHDPLDRRGSLGRRPDQRQRCGRTHDSSDETGPEHGARLGQPEPLETARTGFTTQRTDASDRSTAGTEARMKRRCGEIEPDSRAGAPGNAS